MNKLLDIRTYLQDLYNSTKENFWVGERFKFQNGEFGWYEWQQVKDYLEKKPIITSSGKEKILNPNYRTTLKNEIVLETDLTKEENAKIAERIIRGLREKDYSFSCYFTGNKSYHIHLFFKSELSELNDFQRTKAKNIFVEQFPKDISDLIDRSNLTKKHMILIPGALHLKTNNSKTLIASNIPEILNNFPEMLLEEAKKTPEPKQDLSGLSYAPGKCLACEYSLNNYISQLKGLTRYENISPNLSAYIRGKKDRDELAQKYYSIQQKETSELECWDKKPSEFSCKQLSFYMNSIGLGKICDLCLINGGYKGGIINARS